MSMSFGDSPAVVGGTGSVTERTPPGLQWGIQGPAFGARGQGNTYTDKGIGSAECFGTPTPTPPPPTPDYNDIYNLKIVSNVTERYARTTVTGDIANRGSNINDVTFTYQIPQTAFISNVTVIIDGKEYIGQVQDIRNPQYQTGPSAVSSDGRVVLVTKRDPTKDTITLRVRDVDPNGIANFELIYDELLQRRQGQYNHRINVWPGQVVDNMQIDVYVIEPQGIDYITAEYEGSDDASSIIDSADLDDTIRRTNRNRVHVRYAPTRDEQLDYGTKGLDGDFIVSYDLFRTQAGSHSQVQNGYFVHFFAPTSLRYAAKHLVFVIDVSASMAGTKLSQTKEAMDEIFNNLSPNDRFNVIAFSDGIEHWRSRRLVPASVSNVRDARTFVNGLKDQGETNLTAAILEADRLLDQEAAYLPDNEEVLSMMIVLSDGKPTRGITEPNEIIRVVDAALNGEHALFALGFVSVGRNVSLDFNLLLQLALRNKGQARKIYSSADVSDQLTRFYIEVSKPLLFGIEMDYPGAVARPETITNRLFPVFFDGSELVTAGKINPNPSSNTLRGTINGNTVTGDFQRIHNANIRYTSPELSQENSVDRVVERIWTIKTIQDLVNLYAVTDDPNTRQTLADRIAELALPYNLVTPLTPLVLTNKNDGQPADSSKFPLPTVVHSGAILDALKHALENVDQGKGTKPDGKKNKPVHTQSSDGIEVKRINIDSMIALRFATTTVTTTMENTGTDAGYAVFKQKLPNDAFITDFTMSVDGKTYRGEPNQVRDDIRSDLRDGSLEAGHGGGYVSQLNPDTKMFLVSSRLKPKQIATYSLTYEYLIPRRNGIYEQRYGIYPGQIVDDLSINVDIVEPQGIIEGNVKLQDKKDHDMTNLIRKERDSHWTFSYRPNHRDQTRISPDGIMGDFVVQYDVAHPDATSGGTIQAQNNFFVHHFSPTWLTALNKNVIFVIDTSSSMAGTKLMQTKDALNTILSDMRSGDKFNIISFSNQIDFLDRYKMVEVNPNNVQYAKAYVDDLREQDATNLNQAILDGIKMLRRDDERRRGQEEIVSMLIVLTDGEPTYGVTDTAEIEKNVKDAIADDYSLFALGFGENVDYNFLTRLAVQNHGVARQIPVSADASILLENFYDEVATPLLFDIEFFYSDGVKPKSLSERFFPNYFNGSELVIVGQLDDIRRRDDLTSFVYAKSATDELSLTATTDTRNQFQPELIRAGVPSDHIERLWAYHIIQTLVRDRTLKENNPSAVDELTREIVDTSLSYKVLNPFTTMTITDGSGGNQVAMSVTDKALPAVQREELEMLLSPRGSTVQTPDPSPNTRPTPGGPDTCSACNCNCQGQPNTGVDLIELVNDKSLGFQLSATLTSSLTAKNGKGSQLSVLFSEIYLTYQPQGTGVTHDIVFDNDAMTLSSLQIIISWGGKWELPNSAGGLTIRIKGRRATIEIGAEISLTIERRRPSRGVPGNLELLVEDDTGFSRNAKGLLINAKQ